jgi:hypothetical protein
LIEAIDNDLRDVTTDVELKKPGAGIAFLMGELDRRSRLGFAQSSARRETNVFASDAKVAAETAAAKSDDRGKGGAAGEGGTISLEDSGADRRPRWP